METARSAIPISDSDLDALKSTAEKHLTHINGGSDLEQILKALAPEETYRTTPLELEMVYTIRHATCLYIWACKWLFSHTGQEQEAARSDLPTDSIRNKQKFSSAYALFVMANAITDDCHDLIKSKDNLATLKPNFRFNVGSNFSQDLQLIFSYYVDALQADDGNGVKLVKNSIDVVAITRDFWEVVAAKALDECKRAEPEIQAVVANTTFKNNDFVITGFTIEKRTEKKSISFVPVQPEEIVGNTEAVIMLLRLCDRLALYDPELKKNPLCEIGGLYESNLLDGPPGTGKTTLQRMALTRLASRADQVNLPYLFRSLEAKDIKSEWYGKSGKMLADIIEAITADSTIALLLVDDIDLLLSNRDDPGTGGADRDLLKGLMDFFSGVGTNYRGNYSSIAATNKPTGVDDALRQRFVYRVMVTGAETWEDYADLVALQLKKPLKYGLVTIADNGYKPLQRIRSKTVLGQKKMYNKAGAWTDIGHCIMELHSKNPSFTARSVKNSMDVVIAKAGDFEIPDNWFTDSAVFLKQPWDTRVAMVKSLFGVISTDAIINSLTEQAESEVRYNEMKYVNKKS